jgi:phosphoribosylglycinamide formyltransferase-1
MLNLGVLVSGRGSNLQSIIDHIESGELHAKIAVVISDQEDAYALERARKHGITTEFNPAPKGIEREYYDTQMVKLLNMYEVDLVILAGFMRIITPAIINAFPNRIMNIHPALLPAFPGLHVQRKAVEYGVKFSGCTVHFVDEGMDTGPIILQAVVPVLDDDNEDTLAARILKEEHKLFPKAIELYAQGRLQINGRRVLIKED